MVELKTGITLKFPSNNLSNVSNRFYVRTSETDFNRLTKSGYYFGKLAQNTPDGTTDSNWIVEVQAFDNNPNYVFQRVTRASDKAIFTRMQDGGRWSDWEVLARKSDLDSYFKTLDLPSNETVTYTPTNFCIIIAEIFNNMIFSFVHIESAGAWVLPIKENETISISVDDSNRKNLLIKNSNSSSGRIFILNFKS